MRAPRSGAPAAAASIQPLHPGRSRIGDAVVRALGLLAIMGLGVVFGVAVGGCAAPLPTSDHAAHADGAQLDTYSLLREATEASRAPIHVVVKSFAASMAACITTLADHSYAYPNAIILHHQMSSGMSGNMTQQMESLENSFEWQRRLASPIADKMGVSLDRFVELMYENNSDGDWEEFAERAVELRWVDHVVNEVRETGLRDQPGTESASLNAIFQAMQTDENGRKFIELPPLQPFDHYFLYDPTNFYCEAR